MHALAPLALLLSSLSLLSPTLATSTFRAVDPKYTFEIHETPDCRPGIFALKVSDNQSWCSPAPEFGFRAAKITSNSGNCTISFVADNACEQALAASPGDIKADGECHALPGGVLTYGVKCD